MQLLCLTPLKLCFKLVHLASLRCDDHFHPRQSQRLSFPKDTILRTMGSVEETTKCAELPHWAPLAPHFLTILNPSVCFHSSPPCVLLFPRPSKHYSEWMRPCLSITVPLSVCLSPFVQATMSLKQKQNHLFLETRTESHMTPTTMTPSCMCACVPQAAILQEQIVLCAVSSKQTRTNNKNPLTIKEQQKLERENLNWIKGLELGFEKQDFTWGKSIIVQKQSDLTKTACITCDYLTQTHALQTTLHSLAKY